MFSETDKEIELVRGLVALRFPVYETRVTPQAVQFLVTVDPATMEAKFEDLRKDLVPKNYIPFLAREGGEYAVLVQRRPQQRFLGWHMNLLLLVLTIATTMWAGAVYWAEYGKVPWTSLEAIAMGTLTFTLPLMGILGIHEMGHYVVARRYKVHASLPFFIPAPGTILGTFGAMISMRDPMPNRKALIDIGAAGPILGLLTAIPVTLLGLYLMAVDPRPASPNSGGGLAIDLPYLYVILSWFVPIPQGAILHPTAFAGWVGLFVTALNLLPAGQLDGGHVARAVLGENGRYLSYGALMFMFVLGLAYPGWFIIAIFILLMGSRHPPPLNDLNRLDAKRHVLAVAVVAVLVLSFVAIPVNLIEPKTSVRFEAPGARGVALLELNASVVDESTASASFRLNNTGNMETTVNLTLFLPNFPDNLTVTFFGLAVNNRTQTVAPDRLDFTFNATEIADVTLSFGATNYTAALRTWTFSVKAKVNSPALFQPMETELRVNLRVE